MHIDQLLALFLTQLADIKKALIAAQLEGCLILDAMPEILGCGLTLGNTMQACASDYCGGRDSA